MPWSRGIAGGREWSHSSLATSQVCGDESGRGRGAGRKMLLKDRVGRKGQVPEACWKGKEEFILAPFMGEWCQLRRWEECTCQCWVTWGQEAVGQRQVLVTPSMGASEQVPRHPRGRGLDSLLLREEGVLGERNSVPSTLCRDGCSFHMKELWGRERGASIRAPGVYQEQGFSWNVMFIWRHVGLEEEIRHPSFCLRTLSLCLQLLTFPAQFPLTLHWSSLSPPAPHWSSHWTI